ncbi:hypothetical protein AB0M46_26975 [Dactylosporangium sp. NPDC051485]|uniref:TSCPD domain-containing protein n=1 Tax=Dactylosporangium sp. NPDC051485 TaxID=3154846 RepID=UPI003427F06D
MDVVIGGEHGVLTVGHSGGNGDGAPCWMQLRVGAHGSAVSGLTDALATAVTVGLQHGVPPAAVADELCRIDGSQPGEHADALAEMLTSVGRAGLAGAAGAAGP